MGYFHTKAILCRDQFDVRKSGNAEIAADQTGSSLPWRIDIYHAGGRELKNRRRRDPSSPVEDNKTWLACRAPKGWTTDKLGKCTGRRMNSSAREHHSNLAISVGRYTATPWVSHQGMK
ncbi:uncharacterized protein STEHIDRAFT_130278 [Stereum hirsutum FP-91666 SS1]|uniref:uncharacterized protein n=1 Tax=Stereum hirsutum (strain FP-91666) TaxID=721885 RepID=UPI000440C5B2|nr:uncharacterized protein STEHIDRAFT_130278 [Stereum hirsutum FP-91666 SS1]EIM88337.1 hypothetical protein STEHIDRAFT_130278 [Stereum hirsutum FP-91666 SS1]